MKRTTQKEKWKNIIAYIISVYDVTENNGLSEKENEKLIKDRNEFLLKNYTITWNQKTVKKMKANRLFKIE